MASRKLTPEQRDAAAKNAADLIAGGTGGAGKKAKKKADPNSPKEKAAKSEVARQRKGQREGKVKQSGTPRKETTPASAGAAEGQAFTFLGSDNPDTRATPGMSPGYYQPAPGTEGVSRGWSADTPDVIEYSDFNAQRKARVKANKVRRRGNINDEAVDNAMRGPSLTLDQAKARRTYLFGQEEGATPTDEPAAVSGFVVKDDGTLAMIKALRPNQLQVKSKAKVTREGLDEAARVGQTIKAAENLKKVADATTGTVKTGRYQSLAVTDQDGKTTVEGSEVPRPATATDMYTDPTTGRQADTARSQQPEGVQGLEEAAYLLTTIGQGRGYQGGASKQVQKYNIANATQGTKDYLLRSITADLPRSRVSQTSGRPQRTPLSDQLSRFINTLSEEKGAITAQAESYDPSQPPVIPKMREKSPYESEETYKRYTERFAAENEPLKGLSTSAELHGGGYVEQIVGKEQAAEVAQQLNTGRSSARRATPGPTPVLGQDRPPGVSSDAVQALDILNEQLKMIKDPSERIKEAQRLATDFMGSQPKLTGVNRRPNESLGQALERESVVLENNRNITPKNIPAPPVKGGGPAKRYSRDISPDERQRMLEAYNKSGGIGPSIRSLRQGRRAAGLGSQSVGEDLRTMSIDRRTTSDIESTLMEDYPGRGGGDKAAASYFDASGDGWGAVGVRASKGSWIGPAGEFADDEDTIDQTLKARDLGDLYVTQPRLASQFDRTPGAAGAVKTRTLKPGTPEYNAHFGGLTERSLRRPDAKSIDLKPEKE